MPEAASYLSALPATRARFSAAVSGAMLAAAIGCLQPAIDPVFLTLLSAASGLPLEAHGLVVGMTQTGAALGGLAVWQYGHRLPARLFAGAALLAALCAVLTASAPSLALLLALRGIYGAAMGMVFARAMACCAQHQPSAAYGGMFLLQLLLATLLSIALPALAEAYGAVFALGAMALAPLIAAAALGVSGNTDQRGSSALPPAAATPVPAAGWALAGANGAVISATMLVWSFSGAMAAQAGIGERTIGAAVALGSLAGAATAIAVMRERVVIPMPITALLGGAMIASPLFATAAGSDLIFSAAIIALNVGSTALIIRCSGLATLTSEDARFRTFVACTHSLGMIAGPLLGSLLLARLGHSGLVAGTGAILATAIGAVIFAANRGAIGATRMSTGSVAKARQSA